jgi:hypothetical protein
MKSYIKTWLILKVILLNEIIFFIIFIIITLRLFTNNACFIFIIIKVHEMYIFFIFYMNN